MTAAVRVPASTANLGPGFDSFAAILDSPLFDYLHAPDWRTYQRASVRRTCEDHEIDAFVVVAHDGAVGLGFRQGEVFGLSRAVRCMVSMRRRRVSSLERARLRVEGASVLTARSSPPVGCSSNSRRQARVGPARWRPDCP